VKFLPLPLRATLLPLLLLGLLSSCAVYDTVFHPHRLPTPKMDAAAQAKYRAAEKARHKGLSLKAPEPSTNATDTGGSDAAAPGAAPGSTDDKKKTLTYGELPEGTRIKYDKQGLVRKGMLDRMANNGHKLHHYDTRPLTPREASRDNRKIRKKGHTDHGRDAAPREKAAREPLDPALDTGPDPGAPASTPSSPTEEPATARKKADKKAPRPAPTRPVPKPATAKKKVDKKAPVLAPEPTKAKKKADKKEPKPDPTQPAPAPEPTQPKKKASKAPVPKPDPTQPPPK
jgi:hypothetical protein